MSAIARSAWSDPEHVRLASYRSWMDGDRVAIRGPVPSFLDPWRTEAGAEPAPQREPGRRLPPRHDDYAEHRCQCQHLVYEDDTVGGKCRVCPCEDHRPAGAA